MKNTLLPLTKFGVIVSGVVPLVFALAMIASPEITNGLLWPAPFEPLGLAIRLFSAASYLAFTFGMFYTLMQNDWDVARGYLAVSGSYNAMSIIVSLILAVTPPGIGLIVWVYILLAIIYVTLLLVVFRQQAGAVRERQLRTAHQG